MVHVAVVEVRADVEGRLELVHQPLRPGRDVAVADLAGAVRPRGPCVAPVGGPGLSAVSVGGGARVRDGGGGRGGLSGRPGGDARNWRMPCAWMVKTTARVSASVLKRTVCPAFTMTVGGGLTPLTTISGCLNRAHEARQSVPPKVVDAGESGRHTTARTCTRSRASSSPFGRSCACESVSVSS